MNEENLRKGMSRRKKKNEQVITRITVKLSGFET